MSSMSSGTMLMQTGLDYKASVLINANLDTNKFTASLIDTQSRQFDNDAQDLLFKAQKLRTQCLQKEFGAVFDNDLDTDCYDEVCIHVVITNEDNEVVGTCRLLDSNRASVIGRFYSETAFYLQDFLRSYPFTIIEIGRISLHSDYCCSEVWHLLWKNIALVFQKINANALMSSCSIPIGAGDVNVWLKGLKHSPKLTLKPKYKLPLSLLNLPPASVPALVNMYLDMGASVAQQACFDPDLHCAEVFVWLPFEQLNPKYQHFLN